MVPFVNLSAMHAPLMAEFERAFREAVSTSGFIGGRAVADFERAFAQYCGVGHAVAAGSGTAALHMALVACGIGRGDEVITTAHTFAATVEAILHAGATPVFVDVDEATYNIAPEKIEAAITPRTRAILPVHLYGQCADMEAIGAIARRHNLTVIEDAAQAHGARIGQQRAGSFGHMACFSFYPAKNLGAFGDAGIVVTNDAEKARVARLVADHGSPDKYHHTILGYNYRCDAIQAAVLGVKLPYLDEWNERRRKAAARYTEQLRSLPAVRPPYARFDHIYHLYVIRTERRDALRDFLAKRNIATGLHYPVPMHLQPMMAGHPQARVGALPVAERIASEILSLPMFPDITEAQIDEVVEAIREFFSLI